MSNNRGHPISRFDRRAARTRISLYCLTLAAFTAHRAEAVQAATDPIPSSPSTLWLLTPAIVTVVVANLLLWPLYSWIRVPLVRYLLGLRRRLNAYQWLVSVVLVTAIAGLLDVADITALVGGDADVHDPWLLALCALLASVYLWSVFVLWGTEEHAEHELASVKRTLVEARTESEVVKSEYNTFKQQSKLLLNIFIDRWNALRKRLRERAALHQPPVDGVEDLARLLNVDHQVTLLLAAIHESVSRHFGQPLGENHRLRIAFFEPDGDYLVVRASYDGGRTDCIATPNGRWRNKHFRLTGDVNPKCLAVHCSLRGPRDPIMIPDTDAANADPDRPYCHFDAEQQAHMRSIVGYAIKHGDSQDAPHAVLVLDTDQSGFFRGEVESVVAMRRLLEHLTVRLLFESDIKRLLFRSQRPPTEGNANGKRDG